MNVLCHHCFKLFPYERIRVRCSSGECSDVLNTEGRRESRRMFPDRERLWARKPRLLDLQRPCPYCEESGRLAPACPHCWRLLEPEVGRVEDRMIAILGARQAGKSHFLAALLHLLLHEKVAGDAWDVEIRPEMRDLAERELLKPLFHDLTELPITEVGSSIKLRLLLTQRTSGRRVLLRFHDLSGEVMSDPARLAEVAFLRYASGIVLLADPLAFKPRSHGRQAAWHHREPSCLTILESYRRVLQAAPRRAGYEELPLLPEQKYLAVAVTKADLVRHRGSPFWSPPGDAIHLRSGYWRSRSSDSEEVSDWLRDQLEDADLFEDTVALFADVSYFFVSSYGYRHKPHTRVLRKPPAPLRVHEPIFALLDRFSADEASEDRRPPAHTGQLRPSMVGDQDVL